MKIDESLVSIGLPVRNGARTLEKTIASVLAQDHERLELVICDNASTDGTEDLCRAMARTDSRIVYHRQPQNVGILNNFIHAIRSARGQFFRWLGDDDRLASSYVSRCLRVFAEDDRLILVTTQIEYTRPDGISHTYPYHGTALRLDQTHDRFSALLDLLAIDGLVIDPLYGLMRRDVVAAIPRGNMLREDEIFAAKLTLAGPWGHLPEVLAHRHTKHDRLPVLARRLGAPWWQAYMSTTLQCRELIRVIDDSGLGPDQRRQARAAVLRLYLRRQQRKFVHRGRRLARFVASQWRDAI